MQNLAIKHECKDAVNTKVLKMGARLENREPIRNLIFI